jgi:hypothetical protein
MTDDLADDLVRQSAELWSHVPADEPADDAELAIKTDDEGNLMARTADGSIYHNHHDHVCRARPLPEGDEVTTWRRGRMLHRGVVPRGNPAMN